MVVAWWNPNPPLPIPYQRPTCGVCGIEGSWIEGYHFPVGADAYGYSHFFGVCSDKCEHIAKTNKMVLKARIELNREYYAGKKMPKFLYDLILKWEDEYANAAIV